MDGMAWAVVNASLIVIALIVSIPWLKDAIEVSRTVVIEMPPNSNEEVVSAFLRLLGEADTEIIMYDDGDTNDGSLYQNETVVQAIKNKIGDNPEFKVDCVLNNQLGNTLLERELADEPTVRIRHRHGTQSRVHYKIIDRRKAYVSCHQPGQANRNRKLIDCTGALSRQPNTPPLALRRYLDDFENHAA